MSYCRFVPGFSRHPKRLKSGPISSWLWVCSVDYCLEHLTDGFLDEVAVPALCANITGSALSRAVKNLVAVGSWEPVQGGYIVHDYLRHNPSKKEVEAEREASRQRYHQWRAKQVKEPPKDPPANAVATPLDIYRENGVATAQQQRCHGIGANESVYLSVYPDVTSTTSKDGSRHFDSPAGLGGPLGPAWSRLNAQFGDTGA